MKVWTFSIIFRLPFFFLFVIIELYKFIPGAAAAFFSSLSSSVFMNDICCRMDDTLRELSETWSRFWSLSMRMWWGWRTELRFMRLSRHPHQKKSRGKRYHWLVIKKESREEEKKENFLKLVPFTNNDDERQRWRRGWHRSGRINCTFVIQSSLIICQSISKMNFSLLPPSLACGLSTIVRQSPDISY